MQTFNTKSNTFSLLLILWLTGLTTLIYQLVWLRDLRLIFGVTTFALSTVLAAFMAGLALGGLFFGRYIDKHPRPLRVLAGLEIGMALFAIAFPFITRALQSLYAASVDLQSFSLNTFIRFLFAFVFLLIPTSLMGGVIPILAKYFMRTRERVGYELGRLYALYNLGAVIGCLLTGFFLIRLFGHSTSTWLAAGLNVAAGLVLLLLSRRRAAELPTETAPQLWQADESRGQHNDYSRPVLLIVLWVLALEGFSALAYEVIWTRILQGVSFDKSLFFTSTILGTFLFGLFLGSLLVYRRLDRQRNLLGLFAGLEIGIGLAAMLILPVFNGLNRYLSDLRPLYVDSWISTIGYENFLMFLILLVPTTLMGMTFPVAGKIVVVNLKRLGQKVGVLGALDTVGSIVGALAAGFLLVPVLGLFKAALVTAALNLILGGVLVAVNPYLRKPTTIIIGAAGFGLILIAFLLLPRLPEYQRWYILDRNERLLFYDEGVSGAVSVHQNWEGEKLLYINGSLSAYGRGDVRVDKVRGYLPSLLHPDPQNALIVGLGMGVASQSLFQPGTDYVDCVEINPLIPVATTYFSNVNDSIMQRPDFNVMVEDGRQYLMLSEKEYDVISCNSIHPRLSGNLYTKEFYQLAKQRLTKDGVMCQWISYNWMSEREFKSLIRAFRSVFPNTSLWSVDAGFVVLIGTPTPLEINWPALSERLSHPAVQNALAPHNLADPAAILAMYVASGSRLGGYLLDTPVNTDDKPIAEISTYVNKARNPKVLIDLIRLKLGALDVVGGFDTGEMRQEAIDEMDRYLMAEKFFMLANSVTFFSNDPNQKIEYLLQATRASSRDPRFYLMLSTLYVQQQRFKEAQIALEMLVELQPNQAQHYDRLGQIYVNMNQLQKAETAFKTAIKLDPTLPYPHIYLASIYGSDQRYDLAVEELNTVLDMWPTMTDAYYRLGLIYEVTDQLENAAGMYREVIERDADFRDAAERLRQVENRHAE